MIIAVDGPAASGKGTLALGLANHYGLPHLDTGLLYRAVGLAVAADLTRKDFETRAIMAARTLDPGQLDPARLGSPEAANLASRVARIEEVRAALSQYQREFAAQPGGAVLDGRDIGTRICARADAKLFITADTQVRAERRSAQLRRSGQIIDPVEIFRQIATRDENDRNNPAGAFYPAADAHLLDTTRLDIEAALRAAIGIVDGVMARKAGN